LRGRGTWEEELRVRPPRARVRRVVPRAIDAVRPQRLQQLERRPGREPPQPGPEAPPPAQLLLAARARASRQLAARQRVGRLVSPEVNAARVQLVGKRHQRISWRRRVVVAKQLQPVLCHLPQRSDERLAPCGLWARDVHLLLKRRITIFIQTVASTQQARATLDDMWICWIARPRRSIRPKTAVVVVVPWEPRHLSLGDSVLISREPRTRAGCAAFPPLLGFGGLRGTPLGRCFSSSATEVQRDAWPGAVQKALACVGDQSRHFYGTALLQSASGAAQDAAKQHQTPAPCKRCQRGRVHAREP